MRALSYQSGAAARPAGGDGPRLRRLGLTLAAAGRAGCARSRTRALDRWFEHNGPLGEIPRGDKAVSCRTASPGRHSVASGDAHAAVLEDDVDLSPCAPLAFAARMKIAGFRQASIWSSWNITARRARACCCRISGCRRRLSPRAHAFAPYRRRGLYPVAPRGGDAAGGTPASTCRWIICCSIPTIRTLFARLAPWQLLPAVARQQDFVGEKSDIEGTRVGLRKFDLTYVKRELIRFGYDLKLLPRQLMLLAVTAKRAIHRMSTDVVAHLSVTRLLKAGEAVVEIQDRSCWWRHGGAFPPALRPGGGRARISPAIWRVRA